MTKLKRKLGCILNLTIRCCTHRHSPTCQKIDRKLWYCDVVTPQSCPRKWGKWTKRICEERNFLFWFFLKLGRRAHYDRFFPTFGIILAQTSLRRQLFKVSNIRNGIHCSPSGKKVKFNLARAIRRRPILCTTLYRNLMQASNFGGKFDQLFLWIFSWNFHRRCLSTLSIPRCKKVKNDQKLKSRGGPRQDPPPLRLF